MDKRVVNMLSESLNHHIIIIWYLLMFTVLPFKKLYLFIFII